MVTIQAIVKQLKTVKETNKKSFKLEKTTPKETIPKLMSCDE